MERMRPWCSAMGMRDAAPLHRTGAADLEGSRDRRPLAQHLAPNKSDS